MKDFLCRISRKILLAEIFQSWESKTLLTISEDLRPLHCTAASSQFRSSLELSKTLRSLKESHIPILWSLSKFVYYRKEKTDLRPSEVCKRTANTHQMPTREIQEDVNSPTIGPMGPVERMRLGCSFHNQLCDTSMLWSLSLTRLHSSSLQTRLRFQGQLSPSSFSMSAVSTLCIVTSTQALTSTTSQIFSQAPRSGSCVYLTAAQCPAVASSLLLVQLILQKVPPCWSALYLRLR